LAKQPSLSAFLQDQGFDDQSAREIRELARFDPMVDTLEELCDAPFRPKPRLRKLGRATRFSDGSFPVFYSSLEAETAEAEIRHLYRTFAGKPPGRRTAYYSRFGCDYDGVTKDLRPKATQWPKLVHDDDYRFCNKLGAEAAQLGLDGLLTPSARRETGTNLPVFNRSAIGNPGDSVLMAVTYGPATGNVASSVVWGRHHRNPPEMLRPDVVIRVNSRY
jgi:hypothetical protein